MKSIIIHKKINVVVLNILLYLSFCFAGWYGMRSSVAAVLTVYPMFDFMNNDFTAFFMAGVLPIIIYIIVTRIFSYSLRNTPYLPLGAMLYALPFFYIGANLVTGLFSLLYYFVPLASFWGGIIVPLVSTAGFFAWFLAFICKTYVKNYNWKAIVMYFGKIYIIIAVFITGLGLITEVL